MQISASSPVPTRREFEVYEGRLPLDGVRFSQPMRVDLLRR